MADSPLRAPQGWAAVPLLLSLLLSLAAQGHCAERLSPGRLLETVEDPFHANSSVVALSKCTDWTPDAVKCTKVTAKGCTWYLAAHYTDGYNYTSGKNDIVLRQNLTRVEPATKKCPFLGTDTFNCQRVCGDQGVGLPSAAPNTTATCMADCRADGRAVATYSFTPNGGSSIKEGTCMTAPWRICPKPKGPGGLPLNISTPPMSECQAACGAKIDLSGFAGSQCLKVSDFSCSIYSTANDTLLAGAVCVDPRTASACPNMTLKEVTRCQPGCGPPAKAGKICLPPVCMGGVRKSVYVHVTASGDQLQYGECTLGSCRAQESDWEEGFTLAAASALEDGPSLADLDLLLNSSALPLPINLPPNLPNDILTNLTNYLPANLSDYLPANLSNYLPAHLSDYLSANLPLNVSMANMTECRDACGKRVNMSGFRGGMCTKLTSEGCSVYSISMSDRLKGAVCVDPATASRCPNMSLEEVGRCQPGCGPKGETGDLCLPSVCASGMKTSAYISVGASGDQLQFGACVLGFCASPQPGMGPPSGAPPTLMPPAGLSAPPMAPAEPSPSPMAPAEPSPSPVAPAEPTPTPMAPAEPSPTLMPPDEAPTTGTTPAEPPPSPPAPTLATGLAATVSPPPPNGATATAVRNAVTWLVASCILLLL